MGTSGERGRIVQQLGEENSMSRGHLASAGEEQGSTGDRGRVVAYPGEEDSRGERRHHHQEKRGNKVGEVCQGSCECHSSASQGGPIIHVSSITLTPQHPTKNTASPTRAHQEDTIHPTSRPQYRRKRDVRGINNQPGSVRGDCSYTVPEGLAGDPYVCLHYGSTLRESQPRGQLQKEQQQQQQKQVTAWRSSYQHQQQTQQNHPDRIRRSSSRCSQLSQVVIRMNQVSTSASTTALDNYDALNANIERFQVRRNVWFHANRTATSGRIVDAAEPDKATDVATQTSLTRRQTRDFDQSADISRSKEANQYTEANHYTDVSKARTKTPGNSIIPGDQQFNLAGSNQSSEEVIRWPDVTSQVSAVYMRPEVHIASIREGREVVYGDINPAASRKTSAPSSDFARRKHHDQATTRAPTQKVVQDSIHQIPSHGLVSYEEPESHILTNQHYHHSTGNIQPPAQQRQVGTFAEMEKAVPGGGKTGKQVRVYSDQKGYSNTHGRRKNKIILIPMNGQQTKEGERLQIESPAPSSPINLQTHHMSPSELESTVNTDQEKEYVNNVENSNNYQTTEREKNDCHAEKIPKKSQSENSVHYSPCDPGIQYIDDSSGQFQSGVFIARSPSNTTTEKFFGECSYKHDREGFSNGSQSHLQGDNDNSPLNKSSVSELKFGLRNYVEEYTIIDGNVDNAISHYYGCRDTDDEDQGLCDSDDVEGVVVVDADDDTGANQRESDSSDTKWNPVSVMNQPPLSPADKENPLCCHSRQAPLECIDYQMQDKILSTLCDKPDKGPIVTDTRSCNSNCSKSDCFVNIGPADNTVIADSTSDIQASTESLPQVISEVVSPRDEFCNNEVEIRQDHTVDRIEGEEYVANQFESKNYEIDRLDSEDHEADEIECQDNSALDQQESEAYHKALCLLQEKYWSDTVPVGGFTNSVASPSFHHYHSHHHQCLSRCHSLPHHLQCHQQTGSSSSINNTEQMKGFRNRFRSFDVGNFSELRLPLGNQPRLVDVLRGIVPRGETSFTQDHTTSEEDAPQAQRSTATTGNSADFSRGASGAKRTAKTSSKQGSSLPREAMAFLLRDIPPEGIESLPVVSSEDDLVGCDELTISIGNHSTNAVTEHQHDLVICEDSDLPSLRRGEIQRYDSDICVSEREDSYHDDRESSGGYDAGDNCVEEVVESQDVVLRRPFTQIRNPELHDPRRRGSDPQGHGLDPRDIRGQKYAELQRPSGRHHTWHYRQLPTEEVKGVRPGRRMLSLCHQPSDYQERQVTSYITSNNNTHASSSTTIPSTSDDDSASTTESTVNTQYTTTPTTTPGSQDLSRRIGENEKGLPVPSRAVGGVGLRQHVRKRSTARGLRPSLHSIAWDTPVRTSAASPSCAPTVTFRSSPTFSSPTIKPDTRITPTPVCNSSCH